MKKSASNARLSLVLLAHLVAKKNGNCQNKIDTFLQFFHSVKPSYESSRKLITDKWTKPNLH
jgi:hypothetical protein